MNKLVYMLKPGPGITAQLSHFWGLRSAVCGPQFRAVIPRGREANIAMNRKAIVLSTDNKDFKSEPTTCLMEASERSILKRTRLSPACRGPGAAGPSARARGAPHTPGRGCVPIPSARQLPRAGELGRPHSLFTGLVLPGGIKESHSRKRSVSF